MADPVRLPFPETISGVGWSQALWAAGASFELIGHAGSMDEWQASLSLLSVITTPEAPPVDGTSYDYPAGEFVEPKEVTTVTARIVRHDNGRDVTVRFTLDVYLTQEHADANTPDFSGVGDGFAGDYGSTGEVGHFVLDFSERTATWVSTPLP